MIRVDLAQEAIRLARTLQAARPGDSEVAGLLALMLLIHARHRARTAQDGSLVPMAEQDRHQWDRDAINEGIALVTAALPRGPVGPYQLQAAIAAVHDEAENPEATDWRQIAALYGVLLRLDERMRHSAVYRDVVELACEHGGSAGKSRDITCPRRRKSGKPGAHHAVIRP